jgi:hypothetical protein
MPQGKSGLKSRGTEIARTHHVSGKAVYSVMN